MKRPVLNARQAALLRKLAKRYHTSTHRAKPWNQRTGDELWRKALGAIAVPGGARAGFIVENALEAQKQTSISRLKSFRTDTQRLRHIHWVLSTVNTRFIRKSFRKDPKSKAALKNFQTLTAKGSPKRFFREVAALKPEAARIERLRNTLARYGPKTARDTAIELGLAKNCLALDIRLRGLLNAVRARTKGATYEEMERALIHQVARPAGLTGGQLDRALFQNYDLILADIRLADGRR